MCIFPMGPPPLLRDVGSIDNISSNHTNMVTSTLTPPLSRGMWAVDSCSMEESGRINMRDRKPGVEGTVGELWKWTMMKVMVHFTQSLFPFPSTGVSNSTVAVAIWCSTQPCPTCPLETPTLTKMRRAMIRWSDDTVNSSMTRQIWGQWDGFNYGMTDWGADSAVDVPQNWCQFCNKDCGSMISMLGQWKDRSSMRSTENHDDEHEFRMTNAGHSSEDGFYLDKGIIWD